MPNFTNNEMQNQLAPHLAASHILKKSDVESNNSI